MFKKADFIESNAELIEKESKETLDYILENLKENGFCSTEFNYDVTGGVVLQISENVKSVLETHGWTVNVNPKLQIQSLSIEVY